MPILRYGRNGKEGTSTYDGSRPTLLWQRSICHPGGLALGADVVFSEVLDPDPAVGVQRWVPDDGHGQCYRLDKEQRPPTVHPCGCTQRCRAGNGVQPPQDGGGAR